MKGALIVAAEPELYGQIVAILAAQGVRVANDRTAQLEDFGGVLFTIYGGLGPEFDSDLRSEPTAERGLSEGLDLSTASACWVECRSEAVFVRWVRVIARSRANPTWVLDGDGVLWNSDVLSEDEIVL